MLQKVTKDFIKTIDNRDNICYIIAISYRDYYFKCIIFTQTLKLSIVKMLSFRRSG